MVIVLFIRDMWFVMVLWFVGRGFRGKDLFRVFFIFLLVVVVFLSLLFIVLNVFFMGFWSFVMVMVVWDLGVRGVFV